MSLPSTVEMIETLIGLPSVSSSNPRIDLSNAPVIERLAQWCEELGFHVSTYEVPGSEARKLNLVARLGAGPGGLILAGHADTVPFDGPAPGADGTGSGPWRSDPFTATHRDGHIYGLGSADMKSFLALSVEAARRALEASSKDFIEPLTIVATADEECTMAGARNLEKRFSVGDQLPLGRVALIGEPTSLQPIHKHKGMRVFRLVLEGQSGHSSNPALGNSALEGMQRALAALVALREELQLRYRDEAFDVPVPTLNLGRIAGGDAVNRICARCELAFDLRVLPGMDDLLIQREIKERVLQALEGSGLAIDLDPLETVGAPPFESSSAAFLPVLEEWSGQRAGSVAFATEAPFFQNLGADTVVMGPGSIDVAHKPNEFLPKDSIAPTLTLLGQAIEHVCRQNS